MRWLLLLLLVLPCAADSYWGIEPGMTRGEVEARLGQPDEVSRDGLVYRGYLRLPGQAHETLVLVSVSLDSFYSTGTVTQVQARCWGGGPGYVLGRVWHSAPLPWDADAVSPVSGQTVQLDGRSMVTDPYGVFSFSDVGPGPHVLRSERDELSLRTTDSETTWVDLGVDSLPGVAWVVSADTTGPVTVESGVPYDAIGKLRSRYSVPLQTFSLGTTAPPAETMSHFQARLQNRSDREVVACVVEVRLETPRGGIMLALAWSGNLARGGWAELRKDIPCPYEAPSATHVRLTSVTYAARLGNPSPGARRASRPQGCPG